MEGLAWQTDLILCVWALLSLEAASLFHIRAGQHCGGASATSGAPEPQDQPVVSRLRGHGGSGAALQVSEAVTFL